MNVIEYTEDLRHEVVEAMAVQMFTGEYYECTYTPRNDQPTRSIIRLKDKSVSIDIQTARMLQFEAVHVLRIKAMNAIDMCKGLIAQANGRVCKEGLSYEEVKEKYRQSPASPSSAKIHNTF